MFIAKDVHSSKNYFLTFAKVPRSKGSRLVAQRWLVKIICVLCNYLEVCRSINIYVQVCDNMWR